MKFFSTRIDSPLGNIIARATDSHLCELRFDDAHDSNPDDFGGENTIIVQTKKELSEFFAGVRKEFSIPLDPSGSEFQKKAWDALKKIPYGETRSYKEEAAIMGNPKAIRAVGGANNKNPIIIIIPCHRVIGADGSLVGYGAGIERKKWLLNHEESHK
ncbi:MAG: methylated-DNA--[protein]-cysteine S-methyltransferase [Candidatus Altimarinota bacterium]